MMTLFAYVPCLSLLFYFNSRICTMLKHYKIYIIVNLWGYPLKSVLSFCLHTYYAFVFFPTLIQGFVWILKRFTLVTNLIICTMFKYYNIHIIVNLWGYPGKSFSFMDDFVCIRAMFLCISSLYSRICLDYEKIHIGDKPNNLHNVQVL